MRDNARVSPDDARKAEVVTKAVVAAGRFLGLSNAVIARVVGLSDTSVSRMMKGRFALQEGTKPYELGVLFVRLARSLDAVIGGDPEVAKSWMRGPNTVLGNAPTQMIQTVGGIVHVLAYLDSRRARV